MKTEALSLPLYESIREIISQARSAAFRAVNFSMVLAYWNTGRLIVEDEQAGKPRAAYGKSVIKELSVRLTAEFGPGFGEDALRSYRQFFLAFPIRDAVRRELTWTHYRLIIKVKNTKARTYYLQEAATQQWTTRTLERHIHKEKAIITHIQNFLLELGKGFAFVGRQQHIRTEDKDFFIDLVFYNCILKCYVLIDLKIGELTHQDIGQMDMYVRMYEDLKKMPEDNPTIGIILCSEKDKTVVKYSMLKESRQLFASRYMLYLPAEEELQQLLERDRSVLEEAAARYYRSTRGIGNFAAPSL